MDKQLLFRFLYVILIAGLAFLFPYRKPGPEDRKWFYTSLTLLAATALVAGFSQVIRWYNLFSSRSFCRLHPACHQDVTLFLPPEGGLRFKYLRIEQRDISFLLRLETAEGPLVIHKPQQNIYIDGGPGSGKSESWIKGMIYQCAERNYAGFIYDWEGDPTKDNSPILSRIAYGSIEYFKKQGKPTPTLPTSTLSICREP